LICGVDMDVKRVLVTFTPKQWKIIESLKDEMGRSDADAVRNIVMAWLLEKKYIGNEKKNTRGEE